MAKPKLALIPSTVGGSVYSVLPSNGDGDFDFSRASAATRINAQGLIETVAVGDNRLNYPLLDGTVQTCPHLLLEGQRTNLITYSEDFSNAAWIKSGSTITSNAAISPDGTLNADKLIPNTTNSTHFVDRTGIGVSSNGLASIFAKKGEYNRFAIRSYFTNGYAIFDVNSGVVVSTSLVTATIENFGNGWYRCSVNDTGSANYGYGIFVLQNTSTSINNFTGNGADGIYVWGAQLEVGSYSTSYIVSNSGSATTRIAEVCDGSGNASTFNDSEGVLMAQIGTFDAADTSFRYISLNDGTSSNLVRLVFYLNYIFAETAVGGVNQGTTQYIFPDTEANNKIAFEYGLNNFILWVNGFNVSSDLIGNIFPANTLTKLSFDNGSGVQNFYGKTKQIQYFDSALTDSELETLTSWMSFSDMAIDLNYTIQ